MTEFFIKTVVQEFEQYQNIKFEIINDQELEIHPKDESGFPILLRCSDSENTLYFKAYHRHFENSDGQLRDLIDFLHLGLSGIVRIKEFSKKDRIFKTNLEIQNDKNNWEFYGATVLLTPNFWTTPEINYFQNHYVSAEMKNGL